MKNKKALALVVSVAIIATAFASCTAKENSAQTNQTVTKFVTQVVTDKAGKTVTEANGDIVTEVVTNEKGDMETEVVTVNTTDSVESDGAKNSSTQTTQKKTISNSQSQTTSANSTTKSNKQKVTKKQFVSSTTEEAVPDNAISIVLNKNGGATCKSPNVSLATGIVEINQPADYVFTQDTPDWHGQIIVKLKNTEKASLRFENVHITNNTKNIIQILDSSITSGRSFLEAEATAGTEIDDEIEMVADNDKAPNVSISFPTGTSSTISTSANGYTGVIYNESKLTIKGNGSATISSTKNANNCICSTKSITVKNVQLNLETAKNNIPENLAKSSGSAKGIFSYSKVYVESGILNIKSNGDGIRCERFSMLGGTAKVQSSACDGIDADNSISIDGGSINVVGLEKYSYKVRRVNNSENGNANGTVRSGKGDGFFINGGNVRGESKKISSLDKEYQSNKKDSKQASVVGKIIKLNAGTADAQGESKIPAIIKVGSWSSINSCTKFLYSSSSVKKGTEYTATANGNSAKTNWNGNCGTALIKNSTNK